MLATALVLMQLGTTAASSWVVQPIGTTVDLHIVRALDASLAWTAGSNGTLARTADGGRTWSVKSIYSCSACSVSGLAAHDADSAVAAISGHPSRIYLTGDGGRIWTLRYESGTPEASINALAFFDAHRGFAVGDPITGRFLLLTTADGGATWTQAPKDALPVPLPGERIPDVAGVGAAIASGRRAFVAASGGAGGARVFRTDDGGVTWTAHATRLSAINGLAFSDERTGLAVGAGRGRTNLVRTTDGGATWSEPAIAGLPGPKEGIALVPGTAGRTAVVVGPAGTAVSMDGGATWHVMDRDPAHAVAFAGPTDAGWKVGDGGSVRKLLRGVTASRRAGEPTPLAVTITGASPAGPELGRTAPKPTPPLGATPTPVEIRLKPTPGT